MDYKIRRAQPGDETGIHRLIVELAVYENEPDAVFNTPEQLAIDIFERKVCEAFVVEYEGEIIAYAIFYTNYSTWNGACIYLEDICITEQYRRKGIGEKLFQKVVDVAQERKVRRMDWQVLDWNTPAIKFYEKIGATIDKEWYNGRLFFNQ